MCNKFNRTPKIRYRHEVYSFCANKIVKIRIRSMQLKITAYNFLGIHKLFYLTSDLTMTFLSPVFTILFKMAGAWFFSQSVKNILYILHNFTFFFLFKNLIKYPFSWNHFRLRFFAIVGLYIALKLGKYVFLPPDFKTRIKNQVTAQLSKGYNNTREFAVA